MNPEMQRRRIEMEVGKKARSLRALQEQKRQRAELIRLQAEDNALRARIARALEAGFSSDESPVTPSDDLVGKEFRTDYVATTTFPEQPSRNPFRHESGIHRITLDDPFEDVDRSA